MSRIAEAMMPSPYRDGIPGHKEPTTSRIAAERAKDDAAVLRSLVLSAILIRPRTADEVAADLGRSVLSIRPRCSDLRKLNKIKPLLGADGRQVRRQNESGMSAIVWQVVPQQS